MLYLDASALVKLVVREAESDALLATLEPETELTSSVLAAIEVPRAIRRAGEPPETLKKASAVLERIDLIVLDEQVVLAAANLEPAGVRSLDAIHLASALVYRAEIDAVVAYDRRLQEAARAAGFTVVAPA